MKQLTVIILLNWWDGVLRHFLHVVWGQTPARNSHLSTLLSCRCSHRCACVCVCLCVLLHSPLSPQMAAIRYTDADVEDINDEELEKALCVLAGSDPENCSYSRVRGKASCTAALTAPIALYPACCRLIWIPVVQFFFFFFFFKMRCCVSIASVCVAGMLWFSS